MITSNLAINYNFHGVLFLCFRIKFSLRITSIRCNNILCIISIRSNLQVVYFAAHRRLLGSRLSTNSKIYTELDTNSDYIAERCTAIRSK